MELGQFIALIVALSGLTGVLLSAISWRRGDTTAVVSQQSTVLRDMGALNDELRKTNQELRSEVAALREQVQRLRHIE